jgi:hypothetical protein
VRGGECAEAEGFRPSQPQDKGAKCTYAESPPQGVGAAQAALPLLVSSVWK